MLSAQSMSAKTDPLRPAIARAVGHPVRPTRPRSWTRIIWAYLLGATMLTTLIAVDVDTAIAAVAAGGVMVLLFGWFARLESLFLALILVLPFDGVKLGGVLSLSNALLFVILVKGGAEIATGSRRLLPSPVLLPLAVFSLAVAASCIGATDLAWSIRLSFTIFGGIGIVIAALSICDRPESLYRAVMAVFLSGVFVAIVGLVQMLVWLTTGRFMFPGQREFGLVNYGIEVTHLSGMFESESIAAIYLISSVVCALVFAFSPRVLGGRRCRILAIVLLVASLLTFSRAIFVTYAFGLPLVLLTARRRKRRWGFLLRISFVVIAVPVLLVGTWKTFEVVNGWNPVSTLGRLRIIRGALAAAAKHPFFGSGLATTVVPQDWDVAERLSGSDFVLVEDDARDAHNTYLDLLVDTGAVGLLSFLWLLWSVYRDATLRPPPPTDRACYTIVRRGLIGAFVLTFICITLQGVWGVKAIWLIMGLAAAVGRVNRVVVTPMPLTTRVATAATR